MEYSSVLFLHDNVDDRRASSRSQASVSTLEAERILEEVAVECHNNPEYLLPQLAPLGSAPAPTAPRLSKNPGRETLRNLLAKLKRKKSQSPVVEFFELQDLSSPPELS